MDVSTRTIVDGSSCNLKTDESKHDVLLRSSDHHRHSKSYSRSRESEGDRRISITSKRTVAQMSQRTHNENVVVKKSDGKVYRRSSYKIANKPSSSRNLSSPKRISLESASSSRMSVDMKSSKHQKTNQERARQSTHGKRQARDRESSMASKNTTPKWNDQTKSSHVKKFPNSLGEPIHEGHLKSKNTFVVGKYSVDRAWKSTYAVLRGHCLCLHPDKNSQNLVVYDHPIFIGSALVDIAYDYTKRSNVFRVTTLNFSEFLFEAATSELMLEWLRTLQKQGLAYSHDFLKKNLLSASLRLDETSRSQVKGHNKQQALSLDDPSSTARQLNSANKHDFLQPSNFLLRFRSKSPEGRRLKSEGMSSGTHHGRSETKLKTWREKVAERFKRANSHPGTTLQSPNNSGPQLSPPPTQYNKGSGPSSSNGEEQPDGMVGCLGIPLERCIVSSSNEHLPLIVETCIGIIESQGLTNRGIYRVPGNSAAISTLQSQVEKDPITLSRDHDRWNDTNAVVSLLKLFFRKLPEPLVTKRLYQSFIEANHIDDKRKRLLDIKKLIHLLPPRNFETFKSLATHLNKVSAFENANMMDARNLAIVFGPTLLQPAQNENMLNMVKDMNDQCQVVESIIAHHKWFFGLSGEDVEFPGVDGTKAEPITSMESQLIEKAQHLEMSNNSSKKGRFTSLVNQSSTSRIPKREAESTGRGMTVFSVESVYCDVEDSPDPFDVPRIARSKNHEKLSSKVKGEPFHERTMCTEGIGRSNQSEKQDRISRKKFKEDSDVYKSTPIVTEERVPGNEEPIATSDSVDCKNSNEKIGLKSMDLNSSKKIDTVSRDASRRSSYNEGRNIKDDTKTDDVEATTFGVSSIPIEDQLRVDRSNMDRESFLHARRHRMQIPTDKIVKNIPNSSLLQPPKMQFRSRSSPKYSKKMPCKPLRSESHVSSVEALSEECSDKDHTNEISMNSLERINKYIIRDQQLFTPNKKASNLKTFHLTVSSLEQAPSDDMVKDSIQKRHNSFHQLIFGGDNDDSDDASIKASTVDSENAVDRKDSISDNVFRDELVNKVEMKSTTKRSVSAENFLHGVGGPPKIVNLFSGDGGVNEDDLIISPPPPTVDGLKSKRNKLFLSLHSLLQSSPNKIKKSFQHEQPCTMLSPASTKQKSNPCVADDLSNNIRPDIETDVDSIKRTSTDKRNVTKQLVRTWSAGNCFNKEGPSSPSSVKEVGRGSLSYESSV